jgi:hypothetical protein
MDWGHTDIHASSRIRNQYSVWTGEKYLCFRFHGHCHRSQNWVSGLNRKISVNSGDCFGLTDFRTILYNTTSFSWTSRLHTYSLFYFQERRAQFYKHENQLTTRYTTTYSENRQHSNTCRFRNDKWQAISDTLISLSEAHTHTHSHTHINHSKMWSSQKCGCVHISVKWNNEQSARRLEQKSNFPM